MARLPALRRAMALFLQLDLAALPAEVGGESGLRSAPDVLLRQSPRVRPAEAKVVGNRSLRTNCSAGSARARAGPRRLFRRSTTHIPARRITGWQPVDDYPDRTEWPDLGIEADDDAADALVDLGYTPRQQDKLLGWPSWPQYVDYPSCRVCGRELWLVFQLESDQNLHYMFGDDGCGHITCCPDHPDELAFQWSSY